MARRNITLIGLLYLAHFTYGKKYHSSRKESYLSCTSYYSGDFVILDCFYRGGLPFPTLTWTGPNNLYREAFNTQRFTINITRQEFVNDWNTIYKCTARRHYSTSYCSVGRGIGSYVGIALGTLAPLILLCVISICIWKQHDKFCETIARYWRKNETASVTTFGPSYDNPTYINELADDGKTPE
ncbi:uncharacterized protein LOC125487965 isoform X3 [Rhincodon typus]|uniref:uncharacterized protein LOC125487965 isoform X3 n=1 Tax=Rhincodon typus TaxID=259920 RepID=UPI00202F41E4|nr:uncharacterized protein LOC125487965 isoform X3 [Rhincodon typus]